MYDLVNDIAAYPEFLPWCKSSSIIESDEGELRAVIELSRGNLHKSFTTHNRMQPGKLIEMRLIEGPFKQLEGFWRFDDLGNEGSRVALDLEFEFSNAILRMTIGPVFHQITSTLVDAFTQRARQVYG
jgi:ribosome-associated toxin RatA of RatAB toxin-antitoxin module